jgi:hypothetical protein
MNFKKISYFAVASIMAVSLYSFEANAQVFLSDNNKDSRGNSAGSSIFNFFGGNNREDDQPQASGNSNFILPEQKEADYSEYYKDKYRYKSDSLREREQANASLQSGQTYSIEEYNRLLQQQRAGEQTNATSNARGTGRAKLMKSNPFTGRYASQDEVDAMSAARAAYYEKYPDLPRKKRSLGEEVYFNRHGYYKSDKDVVVSSAAGGSSSDFGRRGYSGNVKIVNNADKRSTPSRYRSNYQNNDYGR